MQSRKHQSGTVLIVAILLLLIASILTFFTLNTTVFEQKMSGNDLKAKTVREVADAGLAQGTEWLKSHSSYLGTSGKWTLCGSSDTSFPCGAITTTGRRGTMYYWSDTGYDMDVSGGVSGWEARMMPIPTSTTVGQGAIAKLGNSWVVRNGVGAVLCVVASKSATSDPTTCTTFTDTSATNEKVVTVVSTATIPSEGASSTVMESFGTYSVVGNLASSPPIVASGSIDLTGTLQVVTNPNAGGTGVPVSVWTRKSVSKTGTPNSCYYNEFLRSSSGSSNGTIYTDSGSPDFPLCDNCSCNGSDSLSYDSSGNKQQNGIDILQITGNTNESYPYNNTLDSGYANYDIKPSEFPCDLFQQIFGTQAWQDADSDNFCEKKIMSSFTNPNTGNSITMGADEAYLFTNATFIVNPTTETTTTDTATLVASTKTDSFGNYPSSSYYGLVWCQQNCGVGSNKKLGTATSPVLLVSDDCGTIQGTVFGMVFCRSLNAAGDTITPAAGYTMSSTVIAKGGNASYSMNSGAVVYGSVVVQGVVNKANGTSAVVYNKDVLTNLANEPYFPQFNGLPGSWSDRASY
jgi:Tfp pilus assembly protein PilX